MREISATIGGVEIDLQKLLQVYLRKWWLIVLCGAVFAAAAFLYTRYCVTPLYRTSVTIYVNNIAEEQQSNITYISGSNLEAAQKLVNTYVNIIRSDTVLEAVVEECGLDCTAAQIRSSMSASQVDETEMFCVYITHPDPEKAALIANAVAEVAPDKIEEFVEGSSTKIVDYALVPTGRYSPSYIQNIVLGGVIGVILAAAYVTLRFLLDARLKDENELVQMFALPILGRIPDFTHLNKNEGGYQSGYRFDEDPQTDK